MSSQEHINEQLKVLLSEDLKVLDNKTFLPGMFAAEQGSQRKLITWDSDL